MGFGILEEQTKNSVADHATALACSISFHNREPSVLQIIRKKKGMSLRRMADKIGIEKTRLLRLERRPVHQISLGDLERIAFGLGITMDELFAYLRGAEQKGITRSHQKAPFLVMDKGQGVKWASFTQKISPYFLGSLMLPPKIAIPSREIPQGAFLFCMVLEGELLVSMGPQEYFFKEGDFFYFEEQWAGELYNPHQFHSMNAFFVAIAVP